MTTRNVQGGPVNSLGQENLKRAWVAVNVNNEDPATRMRNKLLFNEAIPASAINRATRVGPPAPIVIEKLLPQTEEADNGRSSRSSLSFTALSEERLQAAVKLAQKDLRRRRFESHANPAPKPLQEISYFETSDVELLQELAATPSKTNVKVSSPKEKAARPGIKLHVLKKHPAPSLPRAGQSPPTKDPGLGRIKDGKRTPLSHEIQKLQNELEVYIRKVEELANRGEKVEELLEPEEQTKLEMRRQKQAARSAQVIYVLQQQVKEIQRDIENLRREKTWDTKKAVAVNKLAAAHRGALRALQVIIQQLSDVSRSKVPPHCKELGQLLRQLSLCSAKVEVDQDSAGTALDILQKLETLDSALSKQLLHEKMQARASPPRRKPPHRSMSPSAAPKGPSRSNAGRPLKPSNPKRGFHGERRMGFHNSKRTSPTSHQLVSRRDAPRSGLRLVVQQRELKRLQEDTASRKEQHPENRKSHIQDAGFQQPTVSSRLRVNQLPEKQPSVPWIPTSPHSPPPQRSPQRGKSEPRCLFSPVKPPLSPPKQQVGGGLDTEPTLSSAKAKEAQIEALRKAWLDKMTVQRQRELNHFTMEEVDSIQRLRSEVVSTRLSGGEKTTKERTRPPIKDAQAAGGAERLSEALLGDLSEDTAARAAEADRRFEGLALSGLPASTLESMLLRMEEIQRDEEEVRRRFASITYSDPLHWNREGSQRRAAGSRPASPQPIRFTRPVFKQTSAADIVLEKPLEDGHDFLFESSPTDRASQSDQVPTSSSVKRGPLERTKGTVISVPSSMLRSIRCYQDNYDSFVRSKAHGAAGGFNPWAVAESLAEEFLSEVLGDVASEFQGVVEEYAEAVFTSEFLQPIQSPPASTAAAARH
ncbi:protein moonraker isoform X2 [Oryzias melastigma]|uniref:Si:dkey-243i1.1 n=1 Tax=Oryzias melastigma TaxID=30732 RepID=A0A3B3D1Q5_ORYME|nr:protein moonraker isoform X2 [Oryzias melastigma]